MTSTQFLPQQYNYAQTPNTTQTASLPTPAASSIVTENQLAQSTTAEQQAEAALIPDLANSVTHPSVLPTSQEPAGASSLTLSDQQGAVNVAKQLQHQPTGSVNTLTGVNSYVQGAQAFVSAHPELSLTAAVSVYNQLQLGAGANQAQVAATSAQFCVMAAATESTQGQVPLSNSLLALGAAQWNSLPAGQQINYNGQTSSFGRLITDPNLWNATRAPSASTAAGSSLMAQFSSQAQTALGASTLALHTTPAPVSTTSAAATPSTTSAASTTSTSSAASPWTTPATSTASTASNTGITPAAAFSSATATTSAAATTLANAPTEATDLLNNLPNGDPQQASVQDFAKTVKWLASLPDDQRKAQESVFDAKYPNSGLGAMLERGAQKAKSIGGDPDQAAFRAAFTTNPTLQNLPSANPQLYADLKAVTDQSDAKNITAAQWTKLTNDLKSDTNANEVQQIKDELNGIFPNVGNLNQGGAGDLMQKDVSGANANPPQGISNLPSVVAAGGAPKLSGTDSDSQAVNTWLQSGCPASANGAPALTLAQFTKLVQAEADPATGQKLKDFVAKVNPSSDMGPAAVTAAQQGGSAATIAKAYPPLSKAVPGFQDSSDKHSQTLLSVLANQTSAAQINNGQFADMAQILVNVGRGGTGDNSNYANTLNSIADPKLRSQLDNAVQSYLKKNPTDTSHDGSTGKENCWNSFNHTGKDYDYLGAGYKPY